MYMFKVTHLFFFLSVQIFFSVCVRAWLLYMSVGHHVSVEQIHSIQRVHNQIGNNIRCLFVVDDGVGRVFRRVGARITQTTRNVSSWPFLFGHCMDDSCTVKRNQYCFCVTSELMQPTHDWTVFSADFSKQMA